MGDRQLKEILESGEVDEVKIQETQVREEILRSILNGVFTASIPAADAENGAIFFNQDTGRLSWKSHGGILFRFRMQLEP